MSIPMSHNCLLTDDAAPHLTFRCRPAPCTAQSATLTNTNVQAALDAANVHVLLLLHLTSLSKKSDLH